MPKRVWRISHSYETWPICRWCSYIPITNRCIFRVRKQFFSDLWYPNVWSGWIVHLDIEIWINRSWIKSTNLSILFFLIYFCISDISPSVKALHPSGRRTITRAGGRRPQLKRTSVPGGTPQWSYDTSMVLGVNPGLILGNATPLGRHRCGTWFEAVFCIHAYCRVTGVILRWS